MVIVQRQQSRLWLPEHSKKNLRLWNSLNLIKVVMTRKQPILLELLHAHLIQLVIADRTDRILFKTIYKQQVQRSASSFWYVKENYPGGVMIVILRHQRAPNHSRG